MAAKTGMNPWTRVNLVLAGIAACLLLLASWPRLDEGTERLTRLDDRALQSLRVEADGRLVLALRRDEAGWRLVHPFVARARPARVEQLLAIAQAPLRRTLDATVDKTAYGLDEARAVLQLDDTRIRFGALDPTQRYRYVAVDGRVVAVDDFFYHLLTLPARHFAAD